MEQSQLLAHCGTHKLTREELTAVPTPEGTSTHRPVPHHEIVGGLVETLSFRAESSPIKNLRPCPPSWVNRD